MIARLLASLLLLSALAAKADGKDCPYVAALASFQAPDEPHLVHYDARQFRDQKQSVVKTGKVCKQIYRLKSGQPKPTDVAIMSSYFKSMKALQARITNPERSSDDDLYAVVTHDNVESWIYIYESNRDTVTVVEVQVAPFERTLLPPGGDDYLIGHMPGANPRPPFVEDAEVTFKVDNKPIKVRGSHHKMIYDDAPSKEQLSGLELQENYRAALKELGASIVFEDPDGETMARLDDHGTIVWFDITSGQATTVHVVEEKPVQLPSQEADALKTALDKDGHVALYIQFDFNKATLKPEGVEVVAQVVALMKANPNLKLSVQGHTDGIGPHDVNVKLSQERAATVVAALEAQSIDASRLTSAGLGPDKPIAPDDTEDGRARNRRVELVKPD